MEAMCLGPIVQMVRKTCIGPENMVLLVIRFGALQAVIMAAVQRVPWASINLVLVRACVSAALSILLALQCMPRRACLAHQGP